MLNCESMKILLIVEQYFLRKWNHFKWTKNGKKKKVQINRPRGLCPMVPIGYAKSSTLEPPYFTIKAHIT